EHGIHGFSEGVVLAHIPYAARHRGPPGAPPDRERDTIASQPHHDCGGPTMRRGTGPPPAEMNRLMGLFTLANYKFWDRTASHHWIRKSLLTLGAITVMGVFSAGPVIRQFHAEHPKKGYGAATLSNIELLPVPNGTTVLQRLDELKEALDDARRLGSGT